jgi:hypothetical protein
MTEDFLIWLIELITILVVGAIMYKAGELARYRAGSQDTLEEMIERMISKIKSDHTR